MENDIIQELRAMTDGMDEWIEHCERRRTNALRSVALILAVTFCIGAAAQMMPKPSGTFVSGSLSCCTAKACHQVNLILAEI